MAKRNPPHNLPEEMSVGQVARRSGLSVSTIHFYESRGLIKSSRNENNYRIFRREVLRRLAVIKAAQNAGMSLSSILESFDFPDEAPDQKAWKRMSRQWKSQIDEKIACLEMLRDHLTDCIGCGCLSLRSCPLLNPDDIMGQMNPGKSVLEPEVFKKLEDPATES